MSAKPEVQESICNGCEDQPIRAEGELVSWLEGMAERRLYCETCADDCEAGRWNDPDPSEADRKREDTLTTRFEVAGVLRHHRSKTATNCRCCRGIPGDGHIFAFDVELDRLTAGADGPRPETPTEWMNHVLYPLRGHDGARVRITVEVERDA